MTTQTQPNEDTPRDLRAGSTNPILRWLRGKFVGTIKFAFNHPIEAAFLAFVLWIALTGLTEVNWSAVPQNGLAQTVIAGEQQAFQEKVGVHGPTLLDWTAHLIAITIDTASFIAATFVARFVNYLMPEFNQFQAHPAPVVATPAPQHK